MKFITMIAVLLMLVSIPVYANNFIEVGVDAMFYSKSGAVVDVQTTPAVNVRWGTLGDTGLYVWGSYEQPDVRFDNINVSKIKTWGLGGGLRVPFDSGLYAFTELGYYFPSNDRGINYDSELGGSVGLGYDITDNFTVNTKYRFLKLDANTKTADMSAMTVGLSYRF